MKAIRELARYRELLYMLTWRDICVRYKQSILGILWAVLMPTVIVLAGIMVRLALAMISGHEVSRHDLALVSVKSVPWAFFIASIRFGTTCLIGNANLVTKISFPKLVLPISSVCAQFFDFLIASVALIVVLLCLGTGVSVYILWMPVLILLLVALTIGLTVFLAAAALFFRDVKYLVEVILTFAIFVTPIFYDASIFKEWEPLLLINPVAPILESIADVMIDHTAPSVAWLAYSAVFAALSLIGASAFFHRCEPKFAECI